jgi:hypothetical protein
MEEREKEIRKRLEELIDKPDFNMNDYFEAIKLLAELEDI